MDRQQPDTAAAGRAVSDGSGGSDGSDGSDQDVLAVLPRLTQLSNVLTRGRLIERAMETAAIHVDRPAMSVLLALHMTDRPLRIGEIAARMQVVGPHITRQVNELERRGLVVRVKDPDDQRARLIEATPEGAAAAGRYMRTVVGWFTDALADWPQQDRQNFGRLLGRFADDLTSHLAAFDDQPSSG
ncbi:MarR family winged helix-turn-helix transcriptional regulator [Streptomyces sp. NPDC088400]|uniref:MarR family winged helix-turn-helix transcriptional regulator n=1 Tax=Streptomyces sp. NPDC088400 TaxID=3365861 RepID=UPI00382AC1AC